MGIGSRATFNQAAQANVDYFAGVIDQACATEIVESMDTTTGRPEQGKDNTLMFGGLISAGIIIGAVLYKKRRK